MKISTKERIKSVALPLFAHKGYEGTTMKEIAELVGIKKASLYAHYDGKEALFFTILEDLKQEYIALTQQIMIDCQELEAEDKLRQMFEQYVRYYAAKPDIQAFWTQSLFFTPSEINGRIFDQLKSYQTEVEKWIEQALMEGMRSEIISDDDPAKIVFAYLSFREGFLNALMFVPAMNREDIIQSMWTYFWLGVKGRSNDETAKTV